MVLGLNQQHQSLHRSDWFRSRSESRKGLHETVMPKEPHFHETKQEVLFSCRGETHNSREAVHEHSESSTQHLVELETCQGQLQGPTNLESIIILSNK